MDETRFDLIVIGGGEGGLAAVVRAVELGARVAIVEKAAQFGGACVFTGTLPSKLFSITAGALESIPKLKSFGIRLDGEARLDFAEVLAGRQKITRCDLGVIGTHLRSPLVTTWKGTASLRGPNLVAVTAPDGGVREIAAPRIVLAVGSRPIQIPGLPTDGRALLSTDDLAAMTVLPKSMIVVGAGVIGCEYAFIFKTFGADIVLIEKMPGALTGQDAEIAGIIEKEFRRRGIRFLPSTTLADYAVGPDGRPVVKTDRGETLTSDVVLICAGRAPATAGLGLESAGVALGSRGEVLADARLRTSVPAIYGAGDVLGRVMLSSTAILQGGVAAENALGGDRESDERFIPSGIYTQPEIGSVGLTEAAAAARGLAVVVGRCRYGELVKACAIQAFSAGLIKMIFERPSGRLVGAHMVGAEAAELVHLLALGMRKGATIEDFMFSIYHHPSIAEGFREAARDALAQLKK